jgi:hypothetical protein
VAESVPVLPPSVLVQLKLTGVLSVKSEPVPTPTLVQASIDTVAAKVATSAVARRAAVIHRVFMVKPPQSD